MYIRSVLRQKKTCQRFALSRRRGDIVVLSPPSTEETGAMGHEIESRWVVAFYREKVTVEIVGCAVHK
jgi:hypothetical protein